MCQFVFTVWAHLWALILAAEDSSSYLVFILLSSSILSALSPEGRGESLMVCEIVPPCRVEVHFLLPLCVHALVIELWLKMRRGLFCQPPVWVGWCVNVSVERDVRRVNCYTRQRFRSHRVFAFTRCPAALR